MKDSSNTKQELIEEISILKKKIKQLEKTKFNHAEEGLRLSREHYRALVENINDVIFTLDLQGIFTFVSPAIERLSGYTVGEVEGLAFANFIHPDDLNGLTESFMQTSSGIKVAHEFRVLDKTGDIRWVATSSTLIIENVNPTGITGILTDITERKRAEDELRESKEHFRLLFNTINDSVFLHHRQGPDGLPGRFIEVNDVACIRLGYSRDELLKMSPPDIDAPDTVNAIPSFMEKLNREEQAIWEGAHVTKDGLQIPVEINNRLIDFRGIPAILSTVRDITDRKQTEKLLKETEEKYRRITENMSDLLSYVDANGFYKYVTPSFRRLLGYNPEDILGKAVFDKVHPEDMDRVLAEFTEGIRTKTDREVEYRYLHKDGHYIWLRSVSNSLYNEAGEFVGAIINSSDITQRKRADEEKTKLESQLLQSQKMEVIGTLAGGIAHDFNNILAVIIGYAEMAKDKNQKDNNEQYLQEVLIGAERARNLVKQILTFSRQDDHEKKPLDIKLLLKGAVKFLRASIPTTIEIKQNLTKEVCNIMADSTQMHQIIMNLCTNAAHAMRRIGGTINIELTALELAEGDIPHYPELQPGHYVKLTVSDTGHGIDPDNIQKIFDPFFTTKSVDEGTGLGLSVVYGIVKSHGGAINVYSEPEQGATFNVFLPRIIQTESTIGDLNRPVIGGTERILFVDDEPALVDIGTHTLSSLGYDVTAVLSSVEAMNLFYAEPRRFDMVITDMTLPKMNGIVLSRKIKKVRPDIPIILCSGIRESGTEEQAKSLGIKAYLTKPLTKRELSLVVREVLNGDKKAFPEDL